MNIKIVEVDKKRSRTKCEVDGKYYNLPSGLVAKLLKQSKVEGPSVDFLIKDMKRMDLNQGEGRYMIISWEDMSSYLLNYFK